jgi:hypothetical protein
MSSMLRTKKSVPHIVPSSIWLLNIDAVTDSSLSHAYLRHAVDKQRREVSFPLQYATLFSFAQHLLSFTAEATAASSKNLTCTMPVLLELFMKTLLKICAKSKIWGFHSGDYEEWRLLGCYAVWLLYEPTFSKELSAYFIRVTRIGGLGTTLALTSNRCTLCISSQRASLASYP